MIYKDYANILYINLTEQTAKAVQRKDLKKKYLGGVGIAAALLEENMQADKDPLQESQPVIFAIGALSSVYPVITKTVAMFVSPLTGELGESYAGGRLAMMLFGAGYDALVLTGKADKLVYLSINEDEVLFRDARAMKGLSTEETGRFVREREVGGGKRSIIRIGPAGENGVRFASVCVDTYRHFGRLGLGASLGSKNVKAICVRAGNSLPIPNFKEYFKVYRTLYDKCVETDLMEKYHDLGTPVNVLPLSKIGALPTRNLQSGSFEECDKISGEAFAENNLIRKVACSGCPVGCIHIGQFRRQFDKWHEYEVISVSYDYELIFSLGSFLGIADTDAILELINDIEEYGMDAMSAGVVMGWLTEMYQSGHISKEEALVEPKFGDLQAYKKALDYLVKGENEFYRALGSGVQKAAQIYGGGDFAMAIAGNEMPGYHTGYGALVGVAVGARHSHLCNGGYSIDQKMDEFDEDKLVDELFKEEVERCMLNSLIICLFARKVYDRASVIEAFRGVDMEMTDERLSETAQNIYRTKLRIKEKLGFVQEDVILPKRFFETPSLHGMLDEITARRLIDKYQAKVKTLGLEEV